MNVFCGIGKSEQEENIEQRWRNELTEYQLKGNLKGYETYVSWELWDILEKFYPDQEKKLLQYIADRK